MRCFLIYFFLFLFLLFLRRDPHSKGLFEACYLLWIFFFFHREIQIHYLKRKKKILALMSSWSGGKWVVVRGLSCLIPWKAFGAVTVPFATEFLGFPFAELGFMSKRNQLSCR